MSGEILIDTGALVAVLFRRDQFHVWAVKEIEKMPAPLFTCEAVLAEVSFLARKNVGDEPRCL